MADSQVFYAYGIPKDWIQRNAKDANWLQKHFIGVEEMTLVGNRARLVIRGKRSIDEVRNALEDCCGHHLCFMPEVTGTEISLPIDDEWIAVIKAYDLKLEEILHGTGASARILKQDNRIDLFGSLESVYLASKAIEKKVGDEIICRNLETKQSETNSKNFGNVELEKNLLSEHGKMSSAVEGVNGTKLHSLENPHVGINETDDVDYASVSEAGRTSGFAATSHQVIRVHNDASPNLVNKREMNTANSGNQMTELNLYKDTVKISPQDSLTLKDHQLIYIKAFYSEVYDFTKDKFISVPNDHTRISGTPDEINKLKSWIEHHNIEYLERKTDKIPALVNKKDCEDIASSFQVGSKVLVTFPDHERYEIVGFNDNICEYKQKLYERSKKNEEAALTSSLARLSLTECSSQGKVLTTDKFFEFKTPLSYLNVRVLEGDLTQQVTEAIVNPSNKYLLHVGGAAKAIAMAAGKELVDECRKFLSDKKELHTSDVIHTRSGYLYPPIRYVLHACGPMAKDYPERKKCQIVLEKTFMNCFELANHLSMKSLALPAISSGNFKVPLETVASASWNALMKFDDWVSSAKVKKHLNDVFFVNIDHEATKCLVKYFRQKWNEYTFQQKTGEGSINSKHSPSGLKRHGSLSNLNRKSVGLEKVNNGGDKAEGNGKQSSLKAASIEVKSRQVMPQIKGGHVSKGNTLESKCSVCLKPKKLSSLVRKHDCPHKCCPNCVEEKCIACMKSMNMESGRNASVRSPRESTVSPREEDDVGTIAVPDDSVEISGAASRSRSRSALSPKEGRRRSSSLDTGSICCICMDKITDPKKLDCGHVFCNVCIDKSFSYKAQCPTCGKIFGTLQGNQPDGTMTVKKGMLDLEGYQGCGAIVITYDIPDGYQKDNHPCPGKLYRGTHRVAYLPGNAEGEEVCRLLKKAFDAKLIFTVGKSNTTGHNNVIVWNDIHHKTSRSGQYGYPDRTYLSRVKEELAVKGITSEAGGCNKASLASNSKASGSHPNASSSSSPYSTAQAATADVEPGNRHAYDDHGNRKSYLSQMEYNTTKKYDMTSSGFATGSRSTISYPISFSSGSRGSTVTYPLTYGSLSLPGREYPSMTMATRGSSYNVHSYTMSYPTNVDKYRKQI